MRRLHAVAEHEIFMASGEYRYVRDDEPLQVSEKWTIHKLEGDALFLRVDEDGRDEDGLSILSETLVSPDGHIERFNVQSFNPVDQAVKLFKADYSFNQDYVQIGRKVEGQNRDYHEFELVQGAAIYIKQTLYMGITIRDVIENGGKSHVFAPQLLSIETNQTQRLIVQELGTEVVQVGRKEIEGRKVQIADDVYYWVDDHHIPLKRQYLHDGAVYTVQLTNYAYRASDDKE